MFARTGHACQILLKLFIKKSFYSTTLVNGLNTSIIIKDEKREVCNKDENEDSLLLCDNRAFHTYCLNPPHSSVPKTDWDSFKIVAAVGKDSGFKNGKECNLNDFQAVCNEFKTDHFKKTRPEVGDPNEACHAEYDADLHGSLSSAFSAADPMSNPWNLNAISVAPQSLFTDIKSDISGLMVPRLYVGSCFSALS
ncbi:hypothetical protein PS6_003242 [Mucor atramentarius]